MIKAFLKFRSKRIAVTLLTMAWACAAFAGQLNVSYVDAGGQSQTLSIGKGSSTQDLAKAAALVGEFGVGLSFDKGTSNPTLPMIAGAMATAAPQFAADIAQALVALSPQDKDAIVAAINGCNGVNTEAVLAAVNFGPGNNQGHKPPVDGLNPPGFEHVPSRN